MGKHKTVDRQRLVPEPLRFYAENDQEFNGKRLNGAHLASIMHTSMARYYQFDKPFMNLYSEHLRIQYGTGYNHYMSFLVSIDFFIPSTKYLVGHKSNTYKIHPQWLSKPLTEDLFVPMPINRSKKKLEERIESSIDAGVREAMLGHVSRVKIDYEHALEWLNKARTELGEKKYYKNLYSILKLRDGDVFTSFDAYGRYHHNVSVLKRKIRQSHLYFVDEEGNREEAVELDIANSQPFFLYLLLQSRGNITNWCGYDRDVTEARLYNAMVEQGGYDDKEAAKEAIFIVLFGPAKAKKETKLFQQLYPTVWNEVKAIKKDAGNYKVLSHMLQRAESDFFYNTFIKQLVEEYPHIPFTTVHDSIIYPKRYKPLVHELFEAAMRELTLKHERAFVEKQNEKLLAY